MTQMTQISILTTEGHGWPLKFFYSVWSVCSVVKVYMYLRYPSSGTFLNPEKKASLKTLYQLQLFLIIR